MAQDELGFDIDSWLDQLESDRPKKKGEGLKKILMNTKGNKGTILFIPFKNAKDSNYYVKLPQVREFRYYEESSDVEVWHKILPKEYYGNLTEVQSALYDEVIGLFDGLVNDEVVDYNVARWRSYTLFYGYVISHTNEEKKPVDDNIGQCALIEFPSIKVIGTLADAVQAKVQALKSRDWVPLILNNNPKDRNGIISITISGGQGGYDFSIALEIQSQFAKIIPDDLDLTDKMNLFSDAIGDFLGWQKGSNGYFNEEMFSQMRNELLVLATGNEDTGSVDSSDTTAADANSGSDSEIKPDPIANGKPF